MREDLALLGSVKSLFWLDNPGLGLRRSAHLPGNSGGGLVNEDGQVIGVSTAKVAQQVTARGYGIAIRIDVAQREFARELGRRR